ncbi:hypothetical protein B4U80_14479 [Leptotrombidium deliense]|uniref:Peptidase S1 domain-containing protein n=1 Tax=Leptotrombidium deliense TaxID=299467 RepID=A0A443RV02_9ACAR|nr:hypothetical protein B4U80_14479 [Leptotrombidium deliense]
MSINNIGAVLKYRTEGKLYVAGIASFRRTICAGNPAVFTNVDNYVEWILKNAQDGAYCIK